MPYADFLYAEEVCFFIIFLFYHSSLHSVHLVSIKRNLIFKKKKEKCINLHFF